MNRESPWEMVVCEYCFERMHHSQLEDHKKRIHATVMDAEETLQKMTKRESKIFLGLISWFFVMAILVLVGWSLGIDDSNFFIGLVMSTFAIFPIVAVLQLRAPKEDKELRKKAKETLLNHLVKCHICDQMIPFRDYTGHLKSLHPEQVPYEWFRAGSFIFFLVAFGGGYLALLVLSETQWLPFEQVALLGIGWILATLVFLLWIFYMSQVGELKHIRKMRERWQEDKHRLDLREIETNK